MCYELDNMVKGEQYPVKSRLRIVNSELCDSKSVEKGKKKHFFVRFELRFDFLLLY